MDLLFGANSELRATAEVYAEVGAGEKPCRTSCGRGSRSMNLDRFDLKWS